MSQVFYQIAKLTETLSFQLLKDPSTFRGEIKTRAKSVVERAYDLFPEILPGQQAQQQAVELRVKELLAKSKFHQTTERDNKVRSYNIYDLSAHRHLCMAQGHANNFMHPAIAELCKSSCFYGPNRVSSYCREFSTEVPCQVVALVVTVVSTYVLVPNRVASLILSTDSCVP
jgi:hypothetical protein